jgi:hypothetical protein
MFSLETLRLDGWRVPKGAIGALAIVLGCELFLHVASPWLPDPVLWGSGEVSAKVAQAQRIGRAARAPIDVLILGPSHASVGLSPAEIEAAANKSFGVYNGALNGRTYPALEFVYEHVYEPMLRPRAIVLAVSPLVLNAHNLWMERNSEQLFGAAYPSALRATGVASIWQRFLVDHVYLYRYRHTQAGLRDGRIDRRRRLDAHGFAQPAASGTYQRRADGLPADHPYRRIMYAYDFSGPSVEAFIRLLKRAREARLPVVVVNMPFRAEMLEISPTGDEDYRRYLEAMEGLRHEYGFSWLDYQTRVPFDDADFRDVDHLNEAGTRRLSRQLASDLLAVLPRPAAVVTAAPGGRE